MEQQKLIPHLFRTEFRKITAVLCKTFGIEHIEIAEDIASETFMQAYETWTFKGIPENPTAWLYLVAKNKTKNYLKHHQTFKVKVAQQLKTSSAQFEEIEIDLSEQNITDSQLKMLFALCHPSISLEAQIGLSLRILCGFGIDEIANAFLSNKENIYKRLLRAKEKLRVEKAAIDLPPKTEIPQRLDTVLTTLYLLFNEGYYSESQEVILREDLCWEAMRLTHLLIDNPSTNLPKVNALLALMSFHASRFAARKNENGEIILYQDQDETRWNYELISQGTYFLHQASTGDQISKYHLEAGIAYWHTQKNDSPEKWENILQLYNQLLILEYSPIAALNRTYALAKVYGKSKAIAEAQKLKLTTNPYYFALLGELYLDLDNRQALLYFQQAQSLAKNTTDWQILQKKIEKLS